MQANDLYLKDLLETTPDSGIIRLLGQRVLLFDAIALGLLQKELIDSMGLQVARTVFSRFGFAHGWRTAESLKKEWGDLMHRDSLTGPRVHTLHGQLTNLTLERLKDEDGQPIIKATWKDSYEAEQYVFHYGVPETPVCWTMAAFASGYVSNRTEQEIYFIEMGCMAKGDGVCSLVGRPKEQWGPEFEEQLNYYKAESLDVFLPEMNQQIKTLEKQITVKKRQVALVEDEVLYDSLSARSSAMRKAIHLAKRVATVDSTVIISGESGVGKEKIARLIHDKSGRAGRPFVGVNCGALTESLLESEFFGYVKGAFTDALSDRAGLFEAAGGGTLFLDEIADLPYSMQVKLLRVLQEKEIRRIGENSSRPVDVRILAATNKNLAEEVESGRFREDLYYRLRVIELRVPPVRERKEDILPLAHCFAKNLVMDSGREKVHFSPAAVKSLVAYSWPGNVRELRNSMEYALALSTGTLIDLEDLPEQLQGAGSLKSSSGHRTLEVVEREHIVRILNEEGGNKQQAAKVLGIGVATLYRKLKHIDGLVKTPI